MTTSEALAELQKFYSTPLAMKEDIFQQKRATDRGGLSAAILQLLKEKQCGQNANNA